MPENLLLCFFLLCSIGAIASGKVIYIEQSTKRNASEFGSLQYYLCGEGYSNLSSNMVLLLDSHGQHTLLGDSTCTITSFSNFTISSDHSSEAATIFCSKDGSYHHNHGSGIEFANMTGLTTAHLTFHRCGGLISSSSVDPINGSRIFFQQDTRAVLLIVGSFNVTVNHITITDDYCGYGMIIGDCAPVTIETVTINNSENDKFCIRRKHGKTCTSSGLLLFYYDSYRNFGQRNSLISVNALNIRCNYNLFWRADVEGFLQKSEIWNSRIPIYSISSSGLTLLLVDEHLQNISKITFNQVRLEQNKIRGGALLLYEMRSRALGPQVDFNAAILSQNNATWSVGGLAVYLTTVQPLMNVSSLLHGCIVCLNNVTILNQNSNGYAGGAYIAVGTNYTWIPPIILDGLKLLYNFAKKGAFGLYVHSFPLLNNERSKALQQADFTITIKDSYIADNGVMSMTSGKRHIYFSEIPTTEFVNIKLVIVEGVTIFDNNMGSAISVYSSSLAMIGYILLQHNRALHGGALNLKSNSLVVVHSSAILKFHDNKAYSYGGAIYSENDYCPVYFTDKRLGTLLFEGNFAFLEGNVIYSNDIGNCRNKINSHTANYVPTGNNNHQNVSSPPVKLAFCDPALADATKTDIGELYPGKIVQLNISALDSNNQKVYSPVSFTLSSSIRSFDPTDKWIIPTEQRVQLLNSGHCTSLNLTIIERNGVHKASTLSPFIQIAILGQLPMLSIEFFVHNCPLGFDLKDKWCQCDPFLENLISNACDINSFQIRIKMNTWLGPVYYSNLTNKLYTAPKANTSIVLGYSPICPSGYCINGVTVVNAMDWNSICRGHRTGVLCGNCSEGYSVAWGTPECIKCKYFNFWTVTAVPLISVLVVLMMFFTRLTITNGCLGAIVFYANMLAVSVYNKSDTLPLYVKVFLIFISSLNDTVNFPVCLSSHMTAITKSGSFFAFPVFLVLIVILLVIGSYHSTRIANFIAHSSVQVVATLFYVSFAKLLLTTINILTPVNINTPVGHFTVWYINGNIPFWRDSKHIALTVVALFTLIFLLVPFLFFTTFGSLLLSCRYLKPYSIYIRPFVDAYQGPYRDRYKYWFGLRLWILLYTYICFTFLRGYKPLLMLIMQMIPLLLFTMAQSYVRPYHSKITNLTDLFVLFNLLILYLVMIYFLHVNGEKHKADSYIGIISSPVMFIFIALVVYHLLKRFKMKNILFRCPCYKRIIRESPNVAEYEEIAGDSNSDTRLREPLLET